MAKQVIMPQLGESVDEGTLTKWLKSKGESVAEFEPLIEINTDKVDTEIPSPAAGVLLETLVEEGATVHTGELLAWIGEAGESIPSPAREAETSAPSEGQSAEKQEAAAAISIGSSPVLKNLGFISPVVSRMAAEHHLDLAQIRGTGLGGRITKKDVEAYLAQQVETQPSTGTTHLNPAAASAAVSTPTQAAQAKTPAAAPATLPASKGDLLPLNTVRRSIAEHMVMSKHTSPHVTTIMEADLSKVVAHRLSNKDSFASDGANLTFTAYFIKAIVEGLKAYPIVNSSWKEEGILIHRQINIGMATSLGEAGLIVPVIKNADGLSLLGLALAINNLALRARGKQLKPDEVQDGTFTLTNHGTSGSLFASPIINQPQCAILGVGAIQKRVVVISDEIHGDSIAIRPMVYIGLTFDHRILDGAQADNFLAKVVSSLEEWS